MTDRQFKTTVERLIEQYRRRLETLLAARRGTISMRKVTVSGHWVSKHYVEEHERYIAVSRGKVATKSNRRRAA